MTRAPTAASPPRVTNRLPALLRARALTWGDLARRTMLPRRVLARLRVPHANPRLEVAQRVADALGVAVEEVWTWRG